MEKKRNYSGLFFSFDLIIFSSLVVLCSTLGNGLHVYKTVDTAGQYHTHIESETFPPINLSSDLKEMSVATWH